MNAGSGKIMWMMAFEEQKGYAKGFWEMFCVCLWQNALTIDKHKHQLSEHKNYCSTTMQ